MHDCVTDAFIVSSLTRAIESRPKIALYSRVVHLAKGADKYTTEHEVRGDGYQAGGMLLSGGEVVRIDGGFAVVFSDPVWKNVTVTARGALVYLGDSADEAVRVIDFRKEIISVNGPFTVFLPSAADGGVATFKNRSNE